MEEREPQSITLLQLRVIRAFRSTLEDMEEKRSVHSLRSTRSYLSRPMSDISYVDEDTLSPSAASHYRRSFGDRSSAVGQSTSNNNKQQQQQSGMMRHSLVVTDTSAFTPVTNNTNMTGQQYLKVEGSAYRVHRQQQHRGRSEAASSAPAPQQRISADAQTQSAESSFFVAASAQTADDDYQQPTGPHPDLQFTQQQPPPQVIYTSLTPTPQQQQQLVGGPPCVQIVSSSPQIPPRGNSPVTFVQTSGRLTPGGIPPGAPPATASAVTVQHAGGALQTHLLPSPIYGYGGHGYTPHYDPSYCQYLGQAADGYQYELVRRPSIGPLTASPAELLVPTAAPMARRLSSSGAPYLAPNSMQTSIDSTGGPPPATPIFIQQNPQPLSPRHLAHPQPVSPIPPYHTMTPQRSFQGPSSSPCPPGSSSSNPQQPPPPSSSDPIPKLIHETSI